jgi:hypothetical protein
MTSNEAAVLAKVVFLLCCRDQGSNVIVPIGSSARQLVVDKPQFETPSYSVRIEEWQILRD